MTEHSSVMMWHVCWVGSLCFCTSIPNFLSEITHSGKCWASVTETWKCESCAQWQHLSFFQDNESWNKHRFQVCGIRNNEREAEMWIARIWKCQKQINKCIWKDTWCLLLTSTPIQHSITKTGKKSWREKEVGWRGWEEGRKRVMEGGNV